MSGYTIYFVIFLWLQAATASTSCVPRDYGYGGTVCVCNSTYCDVADPIPDMADNEYVLYVSSMEGLRFDLTKHQFGENEDSGDLTLEVNSNSEDGKIIGFGAAFTDSAGISLASLSAEAADLLLQSYYSPEGNSYTLARVPIAGSDFSDHPYTYVDEEDISLKTFSLSMEDYTYKIPYLKKAIGLESKLKLIAAAWTAPPWMKTNGNYTGVGSLKEEYYALWSDYHIRFLEEYAKEGLQFWSLSTGNEPLNGDVPLFPFNCMGWTPHSQRLWVTQHIGPALQASTFNQTSLLAYDDQRVELPWWLNKLFEDSEALPFVAGIGVHWYWDDVAPLFLLDKAHEAYPDKFILGTEACFTKRAGDAEAVHLGSWERGEAYAKSIIDDLNHYVTGWVDWNLALDLEGGPNWSGNVVDSAIIVNKTADEFYKQPMYYAIGHVSKFVPPGSLHISLTGDSNKVKAIAFKTQEGNIVIVLLNMLSTEENITVTGLPKTANFKIPSKSITTFLCRLS